MFGDGGLYLRPDLLKSEEAAEVYEELRVAEGSTMSTVKCFIR